MHPNAITPRMHVLKCFLPYDVLKYSTTHWTLAEQSRNVKSNIFWFWSTTKFRQSACTYEIICKCGNCPAFISDVQVLILPHSTTARWAQRGTGSDSSGVVKSVRSIWTAATRVSRASWCAVWQQACREMVNGVQTAMAFNVNVE